MQSGFVYAPGVSLTTPCHAYVTIGTLRPCEDRPRRRKEPMRDSKKLAVAVSIALGLGAGATIAHAQQTPAPLVVKPLSGGVYWTQGGAGANTGFIVGDNGVIVIDAKTTPDSAMAVLAEIAKITPKPVTHVILTHSDGDHVNGLAGFPKGLTIIAQENCKKEMEGSTSSRNPAPQDHLPTQTVDKKK